MFKTFHLWFYNVMKKNAFQMYIRKTVWKTNETNYGFIVEFNRDYLKKNWCVQWVGQTFMYNVVHQY